MKRRIFAALLVLCLMASALPAALAEDVEIDCVNATVTAPVAGAAPSLAATISAYVAEKNEEGFTVKENVVDGVELVGSVVWFKMTAGRYYGNYDKMDTVGSGEVFTAGYVYIAYVTFKPKDGYALANGAVLRINNNARTSHSQDGSSIKMSLVFTDLASQATIPTVGEINATVTAPVVGEKPDMTADIVTSPAGGATQSGSAKWYEMTGSDYYSNFDGIPGNLFDPIEDDSDEWTVLGADDTFKADCVYRVDIDFVPASGFVFVDEVGVGLESFSGSIAGADSSCADGGKDKITVSGAFTGFVSMSSVNVTVDAPEVGVAPAKTATSITAAPANQAKQKDKSEIAWSKIAAADFTGTDEDSDKISALTEDEKFQAGYYYFAEIKLKRASTDYGFSSDLTATVNGDDSYPYSYNPYSNDGLATVRTAFDNLVNNRVNSATAEIAAPAAGETSAAALTSLTSNPTGAVSLAQNGIVWKKATLEDYDKGGSIAWAELAAGEKFAVGNCYRVEITLSVANGYVAALDAVGYVNGASVTSVFKDKSTLLLTYDFRLEASGEIGGATVTLTAPEFGKTPAAAITSAASTPTAQTNGLGLESEGAAVSWQKKAKSSTTDSWSSLTSGESFKAGYYYRANITLPISEGYTVAQSLTATVNGGAAASVSYDAVANALKISKDFEPLSGTITSVTITIDDPTLGRAPSFNASSMNVKVVANKTATDDGIDDAASVYLDKLDWLYASKSSYESEKNPAKATWYYMSSANTFGQGKYYRMNFMLKAADGYEFDPNVTCTVNGVACDNTYDNVYRGKLSAVVNYVVSPMSYEGVEGYTVVKSLTGTLAEPAVGAKPATSITALTSGPASSAELFNIRWEKISTADYERCKTWNETEHDASETYPFPSRVDPETETFEAGYYYLATLTFIAKGGDENTRYVFSPDLAVTINNKAYADTFDAVSGEDKAMCCIEFAPLLSPLTCVAATVTAPAIGETPAAAPASFSATEPDGAVFKEIRWHKIAKEDYTGTSSDSWTRMAQGEKFTAGYYYAVELFFAPAEGFAVSRDVTGTINGRAHDGVYREKSYIGDEEDYADEPIYISTVFAPLTETAVNAPATDDSGSISAYLVLMLSCLAALSAIPYFKKKNN